MARHGDTRSPSPVGSSYSASASKRHDGRGHRHRSRTRSPDVGYSTCSHIESNLSLLQKRYRDRDSRHHRDRSRDRYRDDDGYRSSRRDRSRDRRRSRDRDTVKDYRRRSRDRDSRSYRDDSRERARRRREGSADSRRKGRRDDSRDRNQKPTGGREVSSPRIFSYRISLLKMMHRLELLLRRPMRRKKPSALPNWRRGNKSKLLKKIANRKSWKRQVEPEIFSRRLTRKRKPRPLQLRLSHLQRLPWLAKTPPLSLMPVNSIQKLCLRKKHLHRLAQASLGRTLPCQRLPKRPLP